MSAAAMIARRGRSIIRRRFFNGTYVDGFYTEDVKPQDSMVTAVVEPMNGREKLLLPEGDRTKEWIKAWTCDDIRGETDCQRADWLIVDGKCYEVQIFINWQLPAGGADLTHVEVAAVSVNEKTNKPEASA